MSPTHLAPAKPALHPGATPSRLVSISAAADGSVFAVDDVGAMFSRAAVPVGWIAEPGSLSSVAAGSDGTVCGLGTAGEMVRLVEGAWETFSPLPPGLPARIA